jgi:triphosphoribosyl-dephospho-CoA synthase
MAESRDAEALMPKLAAFDRALKSMALNPGTSADLTVATLFAACLEEAEQRG